MNKRPKSSGLKNSTALSRDMLASAATSENKPKRSKKVAVSTIEMTDTTLDPLEAVTAIPETTASKTGATESPKAASHQMKAPPEATALDKWSVKTTIWDYPRTLIDIGQATATSLADAVQKYSSAKSSEDIIAATSHFYEGQYRLLSQHSEDILKIFSLQKQV